MDLSAFDLPFTFVTGGIHAAVARATALAAGCNVAVTAGTIARQCLDAGLLDEVAVDLVPVVMGDGQPYFGASPVGHVPLGEPTTCIQSTRVIHLRFPVKLDLDVPKV